jgi:hypothetical protein
VTQQSRLFPGGSSTSSGADLFDRLVAFLDEGGARYRVIAHPPEGRSEVSAAIGAIRSNVRRSALS